MEWWGARGATNGRRDVLFSEANCSEKSHAFVQGGPCLSPCALTCTYYTHSQIHIHTVKHTSGLSVKIMEFEVQQIEINAHTDTSTLSEPSDLSRSEFSLWHLQPDRWDCSIRKSQKDPTLFMWQAAVGCQYPRQHTCAREQRAQNQKRPRKHCDANKWNHLSIKTMATALRRGGGEEKHAWDAWLYTNPFFLHQMKAVCRVKHLGVDKKLLKTLLPLSCQCSAHICFQGHCTPGCPCHRNGQCSENHRSKQQCITEKISLFFWVILDPSEIVLYVICFCCYTTTT